MAAQHEAEQQREEFVKKKAELEKQAADVAALREWRLKLQPGESVWTPRFGKMGKITRVDQRKGVIVVSVGIGQWEVGMDEVWPRDPISPSEGRTE